MGEMIESTEMSAYGLSINYTNGWRLTNEPRDLDLSSPVADINVIVPNKVIEVIFEDGTKEKAVCQDPDTFTMWQAISTCVSKKAMGGSSKYNNAIRKGLKIYEEKLANEAAAKAEEERINKKRAKRMAYKARRAERLAQEETARLQAEREEMIEIQKEAYIRAMREINQDQISKDKNQI